jgi:ferredoxin
MLYIDPDECIDCDARVPECPVEAIYLDQSVPAQWGHFVQLNAERVAVLKKGEGHVTVKQDPKQGPGCRL